MDPSKREELPEVDMEAVYAERRKIAAKAFPNDEGNYVRRQPKSKIAGSRRTSGGGGHLFAAAALAMIAMHQRRR